MEIFDSRTIIRSIWVIAFATSAGCADTEDPLPLVDPPDLERGTVQIETQTDTLEVSVEIAQTPAERSFGLMEREELAENAGMLFVYEDEQPGESAYYMYRTLVPLDIAFADGAGRIVSILTMEPCTSPVARFCPRYAPGVPYHQALEVNRGYFAGRGVGVGDRITLIE